jgi:photosystem II stability/assembly factor-like uncharacterized protein
VKGRLIHNALVLGFADALLPSRPMPPSDPLRLSFPAFVFALLIGALHVGACDAARPDPPPSDPEQAWTFLGLRGDSVRTLTMDGSRLFAGTSRGVHSLDLASSSATWQTLGLQGRKVRDLALLAPGRLLAAVEISGSGADTTSLFLSEDAGQTWRPYQNGFGAGEASNGARAFATGSGRLFAAGTGAVLAASDDGGASWNRIWGDWWAGAAHVFVNTYPTYPGVVWAGGETGRFQPFLLRSSDHGSTWTEIPLDLGGDQAVHVAALHPHDDRVVFIGTEGVVLRSTNGGASWEPVLEDRHYFYAVHVSETRPGHVYVGGMFLEGNDQVHLLVSKDGGASWASTSPEGSSPGGVLRMRVVPHRGSEVLFLATTDGVYQYLPTW